MSAQREAVCHPEFLDDLQPWINTDRRTAKRLLELMRAVLRDPFQGIGKPERLSLRPREWWKFPGDLNPGVAGVECTPH